jgi:hypothetical protein
MARTMFVCDWRAPDGRAVGVTFRDGVTFAASYVMCDVRYDDPAFQARLDGWIARAQERGETIRDLRISDEASAETVTLHDGPELQHLVPGVDPVSHAARQIAQEQSRRAARRGDSPPPCGGLFDDVARAQQDMFA